MSEVDSASTTRSPGDGGGPSRLVLQVVIAANGSALVCLVVWLVTPRELPVPLDIVGYSTFHDFDHAPRFVLYRLLMWGFPLLAAAIFWGLRRWWPSDDQRLARGTRTTLPMLDGGVAQPALPEPGPLGGRLALLPAKPAG